MDWCSPFSFHTHHTLVSFNFIFSIISLQRNKLWTTRCVDRMLHFRDTLFNVHKYRFVPSFSSPSVRWKFFIHRDDNDDQRFHLNDFETPISKETVSDDLETLSSSNYNKSDDCFERLGNDWQVIIKSGWKIIFNWIFSIANEWGYFFFLNFWLRREVWYNILNERIFDILELIWNMFIWSLRMFDQTVE